MFIKLINAADNYNGQPLAIKKDVIISVYSALTVIKENDKVIL